MFLRRCFSTVATRPGVFQFTKLDHIGKDSRSRKLPNQVQVRAKRDTNATEQETGRGTIKIIERGDRSHGRLSLMVRSRKWRDQRNQILVEGRRLIDDALDAGIRPVAVLLSERYNWESPDDEKLKSRLLELGPSVELLRVNANDLSTWSSLETSPGIMAIFERPHPKPIEKSPSLPVTVITDQVRDPSNMGAIVRTVAGSGCARMWLSSGCVDPWETKCLRAGAGGQFRIPITTGLKWSEIVEQLPENSKFVLAESKPPASFELAELSQNWDRSKHLVLILGGETHGISDEARRLSCAQSVHIPLANGMDSLNTGAALAILLFEMKRQIREAGR